MRSVLWRWYLAVGIPVVCAYPFLGALAQDVLYVAVGASAVAAIAHGLRVNRPQRRLPWTFMLAGLALWVIGDAVDGWQRDIAHIDAYPSAVDAFYLAAYPVIGLGLLALYRGRSARRDRAGLLDSAILTVGVGLLSWTVLARPTFELYQTSVPTALVSVAYPAGDILLVALVIRLMTRGGRTPAFAMLLSALGLLIVGDTLSTAVGLWSIPGNTAYDLIWMLSYLVWGAAALHPSITRLTDGSDATPPAGITRRRLAALVTATCIAPGVLTGQYLLGERLDVWAVVAGSTTLFLLVVVRMNVAIGAVVAANADRDRMQENLAYQAAHDALTDLPNRAQALLEISAAQSRAQRSGAMLALLFVDLDGFKAVNDSCGHAAGDEVLRTVGARLRAETRGGDLVARLGGDEFVALLESVPTESEAVQVAQRIIDAISAPVELTGGRQVGVGASVGMAVSQDGQVDAGRMLHEADVAVYRAKRAGKGRVEVFDEVLRRELNERAELEGALVDAIARDELVVLYQPVVDLRTGRTSGHEALVRWQRPGRGLLTPDAFIPLAEQSALICDLDAWVLRAATAEIAGLSGEGTIAVNISGRHASDPRIVDDVRTALDASGLDPHRLVLEITETVLAEDLHAAHHLRQLQALGVCVSIDDFGTGYNSLSRLRHLPVDIIKIDRSFLAPSSDATHALLEVMVRAAHAFDLPVIAEGVETGSQLDALQSLGCESAQGFLLSPPLLLHEVRNAMLTAR